MIKLDRMLMIGAAGTNAGKTELACAILRRFVGKGRSITGIKVTTIKEKNGKCPRGGDGCGVCSSLDGAYIITEETDSNSGKDTARLLAAGADRVFWLRVMKTHIEEAMASLIGTIGSDAVSICESNSLRHVVEPGLFLIVKNKSKKEWKDSALQVKDYADRIVVSDGRNFDIDMNRINLISGKWILRANATAIVMAGGASSRMGTDKAMLPIDGRPMVEAVCKQLHGRFDQVLISAADTEKFAFLGYDIVLDKTPGQGPLMGIASALDTSANEVNLVVACDMPQLDSSVIKRLLAEAANNDADIILPRTKEGKFEPLFAIYRKNALGAIDRVLSSGGRKISDVFDLCRVKYVELHSNLLNLNTITDYQEFQEKHGK